MISCSLFVSRPIFFFIVITLISLCGPCLLTSFWIKDVEEINDEAKVISHRIVESILSEIDNIDTKLGPLYASTTHLVRFLGASVANTTISLPLIKQKVAPTLFQALLTIPHLSQISYIGFDGLFFSYHMKENQIVVLYSNDSFSASSTSIWYTQSIKEESGTPYGEPVVTSPSNVPNTSWFQEAFSSMNKSSSIGHGWSNNDDVLLFSNALCLNRKGLVSLGFPIRSLAEYLSSVIHHNGSLYLDVEHGTPVIQGIPNTHLIFSNNSVSFVMVNGEGEEIARVGDVMCPPNGDKVNLWGAEYVITSSQLQIFGVKLEYVLVVPNDPLKSLIKKQGRFAYALLILIVISMTIFIVFFVISILRAAKRETCLCAALIRQMEATQQAERKSMNKSLAFARASHDVRTCLAGINGLIEISREGVCQTSEIGINLSQMEECTKGLLGIVNSILDTSKMEAGKLQLKEEDFDLQKLVEDVVDFHYNIGIKKGVDIILDLSDGSLHKYSCVRGDRGKLKQILDNLLNNAIKFTQEGHVIVRVWAKKPCFENEILVSNWNTVINTCIPSSQTMSIAHCNPKCIEFVFEVSDTGMGIPKEKQKLVFENYVQVNEAKSGQEGTGLGLGIVQSLVRLIGGEIGIMDKQWGERGTCFRFNAYFSSEPKENGDKEIESFYGCRETELQQICKTRVLPSVEWSSQVIILIQNDERRRIIKHFVENHGIKVFVVQDHRELCSHLRRIEGGKMSLCYHGSSRHSDSSTLSSQNSCHNSKDIPLSAVHGRTNSMMKNTSIFNLILIDTSVSALHDIHEVLKEFRREEIEFMHNRVVWMKKCGTQSIQVENLDDSIDVIVSKPLHGSRLNQILKLLPEYGGLMQSTTRYCITSKGNTSTEPSLIGRDRVHTHRPMTGKRVLVAEDNLVQQLVTKQVLSKLGAEVDLCQTGAKAVELVSNGLNYRAKQPYDYIFMDCKMEGMDGFEASRHIREEEQKYGVHVPIIALTSHVVEDVIELIKMAGMDHYISKPLKSEQLLETIELLNHLI